MGSQKLRYPTGEALTADGKKLWHILEHTLTLEWFPVVATKLNEIRGSQAVVACGMRHEA